MLRIRVDSKKLVSLNAHLVPPLDEKYTAARWYNAHPARNGQGWGSDPRSPGSAAQLSLRVHAWPLVPPLIRCPLSAITPKPRISAAFTLSSPPGRLTIPVARAAHAPSPRNSGQVLALRRELKLTRRRVASQQRHIAELRARYDDYDQKLQTTSHKLNAVLQELSRCKTELQYWRSKSPAVTSCSCGKTTPTPLHEPPHFGDAPDQPALPLEGVDFTPIDAQEACASTSVALGELAATAGRRVQSLPESAVASKWPLQTGQKPCSAMAPSAVDLLANSTSARIPLPTCCWRRDRTIVGALSGLFFVGQTKCP